MCLFVADLSKELNNLSEKFSNCPKIEYFEDGKLVGVPMLCPYTNEQMLMRSVQTIQTQCTIQKGSKTRDRGLNWP